jgi:hypothetical protein
VCGVAYFPYLDSPMNQLIDYLSTYLSVREIATSECIAAAFFGRATIQQFNFRYRRAVLFARLRTPPNHLHSFQSSDAVDCTAARCRTAGRIRFLQYVRLSLSCRFWNPKAGPSDEDIFPPSALRSFTPLNPVIGGIRVSLAP